MYVFLATFCVCCRWNTMPKDELVTGGDDCEQFVRNPAGPLPVCPEFSIHCGADRRGEILASAVSGEMSSAQHRPFQRR